MCCLLQVKQDADCDATPTGNSTQNVEVEGRRRSGEADATDGAALEMAGDQVAAKPNAYTGLSAQEEERGGGEVSHTSHSCCILYLLK